MNEQKTCWWQGSIICSICGYTAQGVIEIDREHNQPIVSMECSGCHNMSCHPT